MFEAMLKVNKDADIRQEAEHQERLKRQEQLLQAQDEYLRRQEAREDQFMTILQQLVCAITPGSAAVHHIPQQHPLHNPASIQDSPSDVTQQYNSSFPYSQLPSMQPHYSYDDN